jgi:transcriptional regulator with XRE-family HTH domain
MICLSFNIKHLRDLKKISQETLAESIGVNRTQIASYESGVWPKPDILLAIADYFGVSIDSLLRKKLVDANEASTPPENPSKETEALKQEQEIARLRCLIEQLVETNLLLIKKTK